PAQAHPPAYAVGRAFLFGGNHFWCLSLAAAILVAGGGSRLPSCQPLLPAPSQAEVVRCRLGPGYLLPPGSASYSADRVIVPSRYFSAALCRCPDRRNDGARYS